jgi:hypothetical protein
LPFALDRIKEEMRTAPPAAPWPPELAAAVVNDAFRMAGVHPVPDAQWWRDRQQAHALVVDQMGMLAHLLSYTSLRAETVSVLAESPRDATVAIDAFLAAVEPLTAEMVRANAFRQEEFVRRWIATIGGGIAGETAKQSAKKLDQLDYRKTLSEYQRADKAREKEAKARAKALKEAAEREAAARGWRE